MTRIRTKRGVTRRYNAIIKQCRRDLSGGLSFGMDWPTLQATFPERYQEIQELKKLYNSLPD